MINQNRMLTVCVRHRFPGEDAGRSNACQEYAENKTRGHFAAHHPPPITHADFAQCHRADYQSRRLRSGVAAATDDQWNEQSQHYSLRNFVLEVGHGRGGKHLPNKQNRQPSPRLRTMLQKPILR